METTNAIRHGNPLRVFADSCFCPMQKTILTLFACLLCSCFAFAQSPSPINVKNRLPGNEGANFLQHGIHSFQVSVRQGGVESAHYQDRPMTEIVGDAKYKQLRALLGSRAGEYKDLNCSCLSLWQIGGLYILFELESQEESPKYRIGYHIIRP